MSDPSVRRVDRQNLLPDFSPMRHVKHPYSSATAQAAMAIISDKQGKSDTIPLFSTVQSIIAPSNRMRSLSTVLTATRRTNPGG